MHHYPILELLNSDSWIFLKYSHLQLTSCIILPCLNCVYNLHQYYSMFGLFMWFTVYIRNGNHYTMFNLKVYLHICIMIQCLICLQDLNLEHPWHIIIECLNLFITFKRWTWPSNWQVKHPQKNQSQRV